MARKYGLFINSNYVHSKSWRPVKSSVSPDNLLAEVAIFEAQKDDPDLYEACVEGAHQSHLQIQEGYFPLQERLEFLRRLRKRLVEQKENMAQLIMQEVGKPIDLARGEVDRAVDTIEWTLRAAEEKLGPAGHRKLPTNERPAWSDYSGYWEYVGRGPLLAITPFNFPLNLVMHKLAPAIASGCPVVLKASPKAALTALCLTDYCKAESLPAGMLNTFLCDDETTRKLIQDDRIKQVSFTGSDKIGWSLKALTTKPFILELGGAAPVYVHEDADIGGTAEILAKSALAYSGQVCISTQNIHVHKNIASEFREALLESLNAVCAGSPAKEGVVYGPLVDEATFDRVEELKKSLTNEGLQLTEITPTMSDSDSINDVLYSGDAWEAKFSLPQLVEGFRGKEDFLTKECFAPMVGLLPCEGIEEFLQHANELPMRLQCSVWTDDEKIKGLAMQRLNYGGVMINESPTLRLEPMPYGGMGQSGSGREGPEFAIDEFCEKRVIIEKRS